MVCFDYLETNRIESDGYSTISSESGCPDQLDDTNIVNGETYQNNESDSSEWTLLDLYSGCGAMSTGLCLGASISGIKLVTVSRINCMNQFDSFKLFF